MAVFFTVQFGSKSRGIYNPANQNSEKGLPGKCCRTKSLRVCCLKVYPQRNQLIDIQSDAWTTWKVTNVIFDDVVG